MKKRRRRYKEEVFYFLSPGGCGKGKGREVRKLRQKTRRYTRRESCGMVIHGTQSGGSVK